MRMVLTRKGLKSTLNKFILKSTIVSNKSLVNVLIATHLYHSCSTVGFEDTASVTSSGSNRSNGSFGGRNPQGLRDDCPCLGWGGSLS